MFHCGKCGFKNHLRSRYCNQCGQSQPPVAQQEASADSKTRLYADIAHPINSQCREKIQKKVIEEFTKEVELSKQPGYKSRYEDEFAFGSTKKRKKEQSSPPRPHLMKNKDGGVPSHSSAVNSSQSTSDNLNDGGSIRRTGHQENRLQAIVAANMKSSKKHDDLTSLRAPAPK